MQRNEGSSLDTTVVEWAPFRLAPGADEPTLLETAEAVQHEFLARQPGFVRRDLLRAGDGQWVDLVVWKDEASAMEAMRAAQSSAACHGYFHLMAGADGGDVAAGVVHLQRVRSY